MVIGEVEMQSSIIIEEEAGSDLAVHIETAVPRSTSRAFMGQEDIDGVNQGGKASKRYDGRGSHLGELVPFGLADQSIEPLSCVVGASRGDLGEQASEKVGKLGDVDKGE
ncbi:unnamed protein product [Ilex paraguariensis]|uniref:Uncharacterized protein n=1 Tax=Ilex paraguariensis TaxID=185542 RepID=A0ABC8UNH7_9AQUA